MILGVQVFYFFEDHLKLFVSDYKIFYELVVDRLLFVVIYYTYSHLNVLLTRILYFRDIRVFVFLYVI